MSGSVRAVVGGIFVRAIVTAKSAFGFGFGFDIFEVVSGLALELESG